MEEGHVLVIGSAGIDIKARAAGDLTWEQPNIGTVRNTVGGVARNIAENLSRLEVPTVLLTMVGHDSSGVRVLRSCNRAGIDTSHIRRIKGARTGTYVALQYPNGQLQVAISDFEITNYIDSDYILEHETLFKTSEMIVIDATLTDDTLATIYELAAHYKIRVAVDPTSPQLAGKLCQYISQTYLIVPNASEIQSMCGIHYQQDRESAIAAARTLVHMGAKIAVVTLGAAGLAYADSSGAGYLRAIQTRVVDATGAGDAFSGAVIFGLLNGVPVDEAMRLGITAASLTLQSRQTVLTNLSQELLYKRLMA
ncbi:MAG: winged helix-turn-helix transcriptional regulator [Phototrophicales bacterium]